MCLFPPSYSTSIFPPLSGQFQTWISATCQWKATSHRVEDSPNSTLHGGQQIGQGTESVPQGGGSLTGAASSDRENLPLSDKGFQTREERKQVTPSLHISALQIWSHQKYSEEELVKQLLGKITLAKPETSVQSGTRMMQDKDQFLQVIL